MTDTSGSDAARTLLAELRDETARLRDPTEFQFVGGDRAADEQTADALSAQVEAVPGLHEQAPALAAQAGLPAEDVDRTIDEYADATESALAQVRSGRAPVTARRSQPAATSDSAAPGGWGRRATVPAEPRKPTLALPALVAIIVLTVAVVTLLVLL